MGKDILQYYRERLQGHLGLLITQALSVLQEDIQFKSMGLVTDAQEADLAKLAELCHQNNTRIFAQLAYPSKGHHRHETIDQYSVAELARIEQRFINAARRAQLAGVDGIELHGANMFFLNLFSSPVSNHRTDAYGGALAGRLKLAQNIIAGIRAFASPNFIIGYRMGFNQDLSTDLATAQALEKLGVEILHISYGIREQDRWMPQDYPPVICYPGSSRDKLIAPANFPYNDVVYTGQQLHARLRIPVILVDEIWTLARGEALLEAEAGDFIAYGRPFLADAQFVEHGQARPDFVQCYKCPSCAWFADYAGCPCIRQQHKHYGASQTTG